MVSNIWLIIWFENLELLKQKNAYPFEYMNSFEGFNQKKLPDKKCFSGCSKDGTTCDIGEKVNGHIKMKNI